MYRDSLGSVLNPGAATSNSLALSMASTVHVIAPHGPAARWNEDKGTADLSRSSLSESVLFRAMIRRVDEDGPATPAADSSDTNTSISCNSSIDSSIHDYIRCVKRFLRAVDQDIASLEADIAGPAKKAVLCQCGGCQDLNSEATDTTADSATSESAAASEESGCWLRDEEDEGEDEIRICEDNGDHSDGEHEAVGEDAEDICESHDEDEMLLRWVHPKASSEPVHHRYSSTCNDPEDGEGDLSKPHSLIFNRHTTARGKCRCCLLDSHPRCTGSLKSCRGLW